MLTLFKSFLVQSGLHPRIKYTRLYNWISRCIGTAHSREILNDKKFFGHLFSCFNINKVFDIGANVGDKTEVFSELNAFVVAVEADPQMVDVLKLRFSRHSRVSIENVAVGDVEGYAKLFRKDFSGFNTLSEKWSQSASQLGVADKDVIDVRVTRLASLVAAHGIPDYIKIDVEGYELAVIRGLESSVRALSFEVNVPAFLEETRQIVSLLQALQANSIFNYRFPDKEIFELSVGVDAEEIMTALSSLGNRTCDVFCFNERCLLRVLITTQLQGVAGGIESYLNSIAPKLLESGHEVAWLFGASNPVSTNSKQFQSHKEWTLPSRGYLVPFGVDKFRPDIVFAHGLSEPRWDKILLKKYPTAFFMHGYFGACISGRKVNSNPPRACGRALGPACLAIYLPYGCGGRNPLKMLELYKSERRRQENLRSFPSVLVASGYMANECLRQGVQPDRICQIPLFPTDSKPDIVSPKKRPFSNRLLFVSRLTDLKGANLIVDAVSKASNFLRRQLTLVVMGDGPSRSRIESEASRLQVPVELLGWQGSEVRNQQMRSSDLLLVPSIWPEPFGLVGIEAGCVGLPSVAFNVGGIADWLTPGKSGEFAIVGSQPEVNFGDAIARALSSEEGHQKLRVGAWENSKVFSIDCHFKSLESILFQTIERTSN